MSSMINGMVGANYPERAMYSARKVSASTDKGHCHPEERSDEGSGLVAQRAASCRKAEIPRFARDDNKSYFTRRYTTSITAGLPSLPMMSLCATISSGPCRIHDDTRG